MQPRTLQLSLLLVILASETSRAVQSGDDNGKKEARDGLFMDAEPQPGFTLNSFADDVMQCNPRSNNIFSNTEVLGDCLKRRAVTHLLGLSSAPSSVGLSDSLSFEGSADLPSGSRQLPNFLYPEAPTLSEAMRHFLGHKIMRWQMDTLYPGLVMRVGPMGVHDSGVLEFVLERLYDDTDRSFGPAKLLMKRTLLPALLGFKLKLSTLMPILLAGFFFIASKAVFFSKLAIMLGAVIGLKSVLFGPTAGLVSGGHAGGHYGGYGLHPVGHSGDSFLDQVFGPVPHHHSTGGGHHNQYGPVSFRAAPAGSGGPGILLQRPEIMDPVNDNVPRTLEAREQRSSVKEASDVKPLVVVAAPSGKRNFAWNTDELVKKIQFKA